MNVILWLKTRNGNPLVEKGETISSETVDLLRRQMKDAEKDSPVIMEERVP